MKVYNIFIKNLKIVSRNWSYFILLFLCPFLLILTSGVMLNSVDFDNVGVGLINNDSSYSFDFGTSKNVIEYDSLQFCLDDFASYKISSCMHIDMVGETRYFNIYLDNTVKLLEHYTRQYILDKVLSEQSSLFAQTNQEINQKVNFYTVSINDSQKELEGVKKELSNQESILLDYQEEVDSIQSDFENVYSSMKSLEPQIYNLSIELNQTPLLAQQNPGLVAFVSQYGEIIEKLDVMDDSLGGFDSGLSEAVYGTKQTELNIQDFAQQLADVQEEISNFSEKMDSQNVSIVFNSAFDVSDDAILISYPLIMAIIILFSSTVLSNMFIVRQVNNPSYLRDIVAPVWDGSFLFANYFTNLFFITIQVAVLFIISIYWFDISLDIFYPSFVSVFLTVSLFILIGMSFGYLIKSPNVSMLVTIFFVMLTLILSDLILPSILFGKFMKIIINFNPFLILNKDLVATIILEKSNFHDYYYSYVKTGFFLFLGIIGVYISKKINKSKIIE